MFRDRAHAGRLLAEELRAHSALDSNAIVLGIPRGGVIVAAEVAKRLKLPLDVVVAAKIGAPGNPEYAIGAVDPDGAVTQNVYAGYTMDQLELLGHTAAERVAARLRLYGDDRPELEVAHRTVVVVDDGIATGLTAYAAVDYLRRHEASRIVLAVPVIARDAAVSLGARVDELVALVEPEMFYAVGQFYRRFEQVNDDSVREALRRSSAFRT
ncbi:MAG: phosphoribosyltransferase [Actinobacteria bacterium]|nr:phosphoribosyltransferase [Actinomycetota bacterium]MCG2807890.1 phosphoribosyltransferase [Coriobacteriia bacterium]